MSYGLEHEGRVVPLRLEDMPRVDLTPARASAWRWRLTLVARVPGGSRQLRWDGSAKSQAAALAAARARMRAVLGGLPERWHETTPAAAPKNEPEGWAETLPRKPKRLPKLVKAETFRRGEAARAVKRDCMTGRFVPAASKANDCKLPEPAQPWWRGPSVYPSKESVCYPNRRDALRLFRFSNRDLIDRAGGLDQPMTGGEFDSVNERYGLRGRRRVTTLAGAIEAVMPAGRPFCLDRLDLETLNETTPALEVGGFRLPDVVEEHKLWGKMERRAERAEQGYEW
jgi:hypothetical protein